MFRLFECCALSFFERFVLSFSLKIERFVSDSAEIWICGLYKFLSSNFIYNENCNNCGHSINYTYQHLTKQSIST